jgi:hypothetical protein
VIDSKGELFVDLGSATNFCQFQNRIPNSPGHDPCTEKETRAGTWRYDANKTGQIFLPKESFVTGLRNGEGFAFDDAGRLFATQHGRDQLFQNWPRFYTAAQSAELPAEELVQLIAGTDYGWPECYYHQQQNKLVLAPEYGGDGGKTVGVCAQRLGPVAAFPGHWALTIWLSTAGTDSRPPIAAAPSSRSTGRGTGRPTRRAAITSSSNRLPMARPRGPLWSLRTALPGPTRTRAERRSVQPGS